jgi:hypothetical protein
MSRAALNEVYYDVRGASPGDGIASKGMQGFERRLGTSGRHLAFPRWFWGEVRAWASGGGVREDCHGSRIPSTPNPHHPSRTNRSTSSLAESSCLRSEVRASMAWISACPACNSLHTLSGMASAALYDSS